MLCIATYDLRVVRNYEGLYSVLRSLGAVRLLESVWLLNVETTPANIVERLRAVLDGDDGIAVIQLFTNGGWAAKGPKLEGLNWLKKYLP